MGRSLLEWRGELVSRKERKLHRDRIGVQHTTWLDNDVQPLLCFKGYQGRWLCLAVNWMIEEFLAKLDMLGMPRLQEGDNKSRVASRACRHHHHFRFHDQ